jgi:ABC-type lipoprotein release transport system permease subunit
LSSFRSGRAERELAREIRSQREARMFRWLAGWPMGVCMLGCVGPTRRALNIEPTIALRTE